MNILLVCYAGMSTSLLVQKLEKKALELKKDYNFDAIGTSELDEYLLENKVGFILIAPQARHMESIIAEQARAKGIEYKIIDSLVYGKLDVISILKDLDTHFCK